MKRILIIGAGGFVGARFTEMACLNGGVLDGAQVLPSIRQPRGLATLSKLGLSDYRIADASKPETLAKALEGCDAVVNLTMGDNARIVSDLQNLHAACIAKKVRLLIHVSSAEVFGRCDTPNLSDESPWFAGHWMEYAREKGKAEDWLRTVQNSPVTVVTLRPGLIWGPRSGWTADPALALLNGSAFLVDGGKWAANLCYVDNLIHSILAVVRHPSPKGGFYNVGDPDRPTWQAFYKALAAEIGLKQPTIHDVPESAYKESMMAKLLSLKDITIAKKIKRKLRNQTKMAMKIWITNAYSALVPPKPSGPATPKLVKGMWWLQTTRYHLPIAKFQSTFPDPHQISFAKACREAGTWLRFSGFAAEENQP